MSSNKPFPSSDLDVFKENSLILDNFVNSQENEYPDRFNRKRPTITGIIKEAFNVRTDISNMNETLIGQSRWDAVPKNTSLSLGGDNGALNKQAQALFNRTIMLKVHAREALRRSYLETGYNLVEGSFEQGGKLVNSNDVLLQERTGKVFSGPVGTVAAGTDPASGEFVDRSGDISVYAGSYGSVRSYSGTSSRIYCGGRANVFDRAHGTFVLDATDTTSADNDGTILVDALGRRWKRQLVNGVLPEFFGALGNNVADDIIPLQKSVNHAAAIKSYVNVSNYTYRTSATLNVPANGHVIGQSRNGAVISALTKTFPVVTLTGTQSKVKGLYLRDGDIGVKHVSGAANQAKIHDCRISYNRIGIDSKDAYITSIKDNYVAFNSYGIISGGQSFEVIIRDNVVDNNLGGGGVLCYGSCGTIIAGNTIEGNRKEVTPGGPSVGYGLWVIGFNQRTVVRDNWFEQNGNQDGSSDIIISRPVEAWVDTLASTCVPTEYQSQVAANAYVTGMIDVDANFFFSTKRAVSIKLAANVYSTISVSNSTFVGRKNFFNRPVELFGTNTQNKVYIFANQVLNTGDISIDAEMKSGIKGSYVFAEGGASAHEVVMLDGKDLFTAYVSTAQFAALAGATLDATSRSPSSGNTELKNGAVKAVGGVNGARVVTGSGRPRAGMAAWFGTLSVPYAVVVLATGSGSGFTYQGSGGFAYRAANNPAGYFNIHTITPIAAEAAIHTGDYYGWMIIPQDSLAASLEGCIRLVVTDLDVVEQPIYSASIPTSWPSNALYIWNLGDTVYNNAPVAGGKMGWVCVTSGSPGVWKAFGAIDA